MYKGLKYAIVPVALKFYIKNIETGYGSFDTLLFGVTI